MKRAHYNINVLEELEKIERALKAIHNIEQRLKRIENQVTIALLRLSIWLWAELEAKEVREHGKKDQG